MKVGTGKLRALYDDTLKAREEYRAKLAEMEMNQGPPDWLEISVIHVN